jgi:hypothetical protein
MRWWWCATAGCAEKRREGSTWRRGENVNRITARLLLCASACLPAQKSFASGEKILVEEEEGFWGSRGCVGSRALSAETVAVKWLGEWPRFSGSASAATNGKNSAVKSSWTASSLSFSSGLWTVFPCFFLPCAECVTGDLAGHRGSTMATTFSSAINGIIVWDSLPVIHVFYGTLVCFNKLNDEQIRSQTILVVS